MAKTIKKKKVLLYCNKILAQALHETLGKNYTSFLGESISDIKAFKPTVIIFDKDVERVLKYATKKTNCFFLSSGKVFSGITELGFQSKDLPNNNTKEGIMLVNAENLIKLREKYLIMRISTLFDKEWLNKIVEDIKNNKTLDNREQIYPMCPYGVVKVIDTLLSLESKGVIHLRGSEQTTNYKLGETLAELLKLKKPESVFKETGNSNVKLAGIVLPTVSRTIISNLFQGEINAK